MGSVVYGGGDQEHEQWRRRVEPPTNELGQPTAVRAVLGRTEDAVVALQSALAYSTGVLPLGTLKLVCRCTAVGIDETVTELDTAPLLDAAAGAEILWPWSPPDQHPPEPPALDLPEDSWFRRPR